MARTSAPGRSPTPGLILGLVITLAAVVAYSWYITRQISGLRELQNNIADRNRKDSLQLLRIQNDLNSIALGMRDMLDNQEPYPLTAWVSQFERIRTSRAPIWKMRFGARSSWRSRTAALSSNNICERPSRNSGTQSIACSHWPEKVSIRKRAVRFA